MQLVHGRTDQIHYQDTTFLPFRDFVLSRFRESLKTEIAKSRKGERTKEGVHRVH
jgi:hypothetical protein